MSAIINAGENLMLDREVSVAQTKTQGGRRLAQKRGPTLYTLEVEVPAQLMNGDKYYAIENEMITLEYGANDFESANISGKIGGGFTTVRNGWSAATVSSTAGTTVNISGITGTPMPYDYFQLPGSTKVYQIASYTTGVIIANTPVVVNVTSGSLEIGDKVSFNFAMMDRPATSYQPGNIVQYGTFKFEEVILDVTRGE